MPRFNTLAWQDGHLRLIDQRLLPEEEKYITCKSWEAVAEAIREMVVRGAPAIGIAAAYGVVMGAKELCTDNDAIDEALVPVFEGLAATRPTAVNLFWALERMRHAAKVVGRGSSAWASLLEEAEEIHAEDARMCAAMGKHGELLLPDQARLLTHCNAGALATGGEGTALAVIRAGWRSGRIVSVFADETRPFLQGSRLTAWELQKDGIPVRIITDNMAAHFMQKGEIDGVVVGTDRIAANGDIANKIGTYGLALLCKAHQLPFWVIGPTSTIDLETASGEGIEIERRADREVTHIGSTRIAPVGVPVENPAFDVTPAGLITAIVTEHGIIEPPFVEGLRVHVERSRLENTSEI